MKKRRLLALPKSPEASQDPLEAPPQLHADKAVHTEVAEVPKTPTPNASQVISDLEDAAEEVPPPTSHNILRHLYEKGVDEDWLQLAWMRVRVSPSDEYEVQLPEVSCRLGELIRVPRDAGPTAFGPTNDRQPSTSPIDVCSTSSTLLDDDKVSKDQSREAFSRIQMWLLGKSENPRLAATQTLQPCDWSVLLDLFRSANVPISKLATLMALAPNDGLLEQFWQRADLVAALLDDHLKHGADVDAVLASWMDCTWIVTVPAKDFRAGVRKMKLRDRLGDEVGARLELDTVRVFHAQRDKHSQRLV